jgi:ABC-2 type transport system permease protein
VSGSRILAIAGRILRQFRHDPRSVGLILVVPLLVMVLVGYLVGDSGKEPLPVGLANLDRGLPTGEGAIGIGLEAQLRANDLVEVRTVASPEEARSLISDGELAGAVIVPADLTERAIGGRVARIEVVVRGIEPGVDERVVGATRMALQGVLAAAAGAADAGITVPQLSVDRVPLLGAPDLGTLDFYAPALIVVFGFLFTFMLTSVAFLRERSSGTLERLMASPATRLELLLGYLLGFVGFAMVQGLVILGYAVVILDVSVAGPVWLVLLTIAILVVGVVNLGVALSFYARNELQVVQFIPLIFVPQVFLGGLFWPIQTLWAPLRYLSQVFPVTHAVVALREVMVGGADSADVAGRLAALLAFALAMVALGVVALRKQRA